jgi:hypothetical protein
MTAPRLSRAPALLLAPLLLLSCKSAVELDQALGYPCSLEAEAEASSCPTGFRCGLDGRCLDARAEELLPTPVTRDAKVEPLLPPALPGAPRLLEGNPAAFVGAGCGQSAIATLVAWVDGAGPGLLLETEEPLFEAPLQADRAQCEALRAGAPPLRHRWVERLDVGGRRVVALAVTGPVVWALADDGALCRTLAAPFGSPAPRCAPSGAPSGADTLRVPITPSGQDGAGGDVVVAASASQAAVWDAAAERFGPAFALPGSGGGGKAPHALLAFAGTAPGAVQLLAATDGGLHVTAPGGTSWQTLTNESSLCGPEAGAVPLRLAWLPMVPLTGGPGGLFIEWRSAAGTSTVHAYRLYPSGSSPVPSCAAFTLPGGDVLSLSSRRQVVVTQPGEGREVRHLEVYDEGLQPAGGERGFVVHAHTRAEDGGAPARLLCRFRPFDAPGFVAVGCDKEVRAGATPSALQPRTALLEQPAVHSRAHPTRLLQASALGHVWFAGATPRVRALSPDRAPEVVAGGETRMELFSPALSTQGLPLALAQDVLLDGAAAPRVGTGALLGQDVARAALPGDAVRLLVEPAAAAQLASPLYWVEHDPSGSTPRMRGLTRLTRSEALRAPYTATLSPAAGDRQLLLTAAHDVLLAADVTDTLGAGGAGAWVRAGDYARLEALPVSEVRLVPLPRVAITALAPLPPGDGYARGYLLAGGRVFRYGASSPLVWRADELLFPRGTPLAVWTEGERGRVGFRDGAVRSLPGRVDLAPAITTATDTAGAGAGAGVEVVDYAQVCGHTFALAGAGLWRLVVEPGAQSGRWREVPLGDALRAGLPADGLAAGRLHAGTSALFLFDPHGRSFRLTDLECR